MELDITVRRGARVDIPLQFTNSDDTPCDLTGLGPWVCQARDTAGAPLLLTFTVVETTPASGMLNLTASTADTAHIPARDTLYALSDATGYLWIEEEVCHMKPNIIE